MSSLSLDIFKKDVHGNPIWPDAVGDSGRAARSRLRQLVHRSFLANTLLSVKTFTKSL